MNNKHVLIKKNDFRGENLFLHFLGQESDEQVFDIQCDESFSGYMSNNFENPLFFVEGVDFEIYKKQVGSRVVKDNNGIHYDYHTYFQYFAKLK